ncbi:Putative transcriptional regulator YwtF [Streptomyces sp. ADI95-16]|uniref:LCP family protein n=1 Tax=Streptomyces sp. ADI95-16 TaxID=1522758 RepID=UPI000F3A9C76|nr:LCP family protein [Streptomyces sp. ADI95-16]AYV32174.1 Putative transcriptional regulator YwtF [Streptomyces sp. ADI95-16]
MGILAGLVLLAGGASGWLYQRLDGNISASDVDDMLGGDRPASLSPGAKNILLVGSDSRDGANAKYGKDLATMQSDTLMVLHIAANRKWGAVVSLPRDSWVEVPACDRGDGSQSAPRHFKINSAFAVGGARGDVGSAAACTIKAIEHNTGLRMDHFITLDFQGFKGMVNALGGVEVCRPKAIHDVKAHLDLGAGCQVVKDEQALGYVRTRYSVGDGSDIGRIGRQQEFMQALVTKAQQKLTSPGDVYGFLDSATKSVTTDKALAGIRPLYGLASKIRDIPEDRLTFVTVPNYPREVDIPTDKANISWQYPQTHDLFSALARDEEISKAKLASAPSVAAGSVQVLVLNGTGRPGMAAAVACQLRSAGYTVTGTGNAPRFAELTRVTHPPTGLAVHAETLASQLKTSVSPETNTSAAPRVITLTVGSDYSGLFG